jgi:hypothetical protein
MDARVVPQSPPLVAPPWWAWPLLLPGPVLAWHSLVADELASTPAAPEWYAAPALAWAGVALVLFGLLAETAFYSMLWHARRIRMPIVPCLLALLQLSMLEVVASIVIHGAPEVGAGRTFAVLLCGARARWGGATPPGLAAAFGSVGALTIVRIGAWSWVQSYATGRRFREAAAIVSLVWLASHLAQGWSLELLRGPGGAP